jgi:phage terminase small subunit
LLFVQNFSSTGNATRSAIDSGYSPKTAEQIGYQLKNSLANEIDVATRSLLGSAVPMAVNKLQSLITDNQVPASVKLGAINSILDRSGYQTIHKVQDMTNNKTDKELELELANLMQGLRSEPIEILDQSAVNTLDKDIKH